MRLLFIRHGDPDYEHDSLTEVGQREAELLAERIKTENVKDFFVSPLGRARETAAPALKALGREAKVMDWLREFPAVVDVNASEQLARAYPDARLAPDGTYELRHITWDMVPGSWMNDPMYYGQESWRETLPARMGDMPQVYDRVTSALDELLTSYGYRREGGLYRTEQGRNETLAFFCHFGITSVMLSHLWNISPFILLHSLCMAPSSVTELYSEEREKGIVNFRASRIGDVSHLYAAGEKPSFSARFCEVYENDWERH